MGDSKLMETTYFNKSMEVRLTAYADTVVYERTEKDCILRAIRFGGYPEMVSGLSDAIYAGAEITVRTQEKTLNLVSETKRYVRQISHDGVYTVATILGMDDDQSAKNKSGSQSADSEQEETPVSQDLPPRKCMIFCPAGDRDRLFEEVDRKTAVPLIPAFRDYVLAEMERRGILKRLIRLVAKPLFVSSECQK